jgi:hypothetical protein
MPGLGYVFALVLAGVFVRAAAAKLARPDETASGFGALGVPAPGVMRWAVPGAELVTAASLAAAPAAGGTVAMVLLVLFTAVVARGVRRGLSTGCTCFGAASAEPVSPADLVRNGLLAGLAAGAWFAPRPTVPSPAAVVVAAVAVAGGAGLLRLARSPHEGGSR